ncbi:MAG: hypothetical protein QXX57_04480 [Nitrososphaerota archaeon]
MTFQRGWLTETTNYQIIEELNEHSTGVGFKPGGKIPNIKFDE